MYCMFLFNSLIVGFYYVVRYSVFIYGDLFFGFFIIICGIYIIFVLWIFDCLGYFVFMVVYMVLICCLWVVLKLIGRKGYVGW